MAFTTKVIILGGFLGSGKTTVLLQMARYLTAHSKRKMPLVILENEIGEVSVDGGVVEGSGYSVKNLLAGCACCELLGSLPAAVQSIVNDYEPEVLIVEATGIAVPSSMVQAITQVCPQVRVAVLVDASRWQRIRIPLKPLLTQQLESANVILINKCDLVDEQTLDEVKRDVLSYGGTSLVICVSAQAGISEETLQSIFDIENKEQV